MKTDLNTPVESESKNHIWQWDLNIVKYSGDLNTRHWNSGTIWTSDNLVSTIQMPIKSTVFKWHLNGRLNCMVFRSPSVWQTNCPLFRCLVTVMYSGDPNYVLVRYSNGMWILDSHSNNGNLVTRQKLSAIRMVPLFKCLVFGSPLYSDGNLNNGLLVCSSNHGLNTGPLNCLHTNEFRKPWVWIKPSK